MPTIYGFLERITYHNEENDFLVAKLQEKDRRELTTIVGNLSGINPGESFFGITALDHSQKMATHDYLRKVRWNK